MNLENLPQRVRDFWGRRRNRVILGGAAICLALVGVGWDLARRVVSQGWPQTSGLAWVDGLNAPATVVRDRYGVPHIFAANDEDLAFAQGYVHAQDRFWQMELSRRRGRGTLAELLGDAASETDRQWQALDLVSAARRLLLEADSGALAELNAYTAGVNAWLETHRERLPLEYSLLDLRGRAAPDPDRWSAEDSLLVALVIGWQTGGPPLAPSTAQSIIERVGPERGALLLGGTPDEASLSASVPLTVSLPVRWTLNSRVTWVAADRPRGAASFLAVDLPADLSLPAPWYVMAGRVGEIGMAGASVPGLPGWVAGTQDGTVWAGWSETGALALGDETPDWRRWLLATLFGGAQVVQLGDGATPQTIGEFQARQMDTYSARAAQLTPFLTQIDPHGWRQERVTAMLKGWDFCIGENSRAGPFFAVYQLEVARAALADELGDALFEAYVAEGRLYQAALDQIIQNPDDEWWDDVSTPERELRSDVLERAYDPALEWIGRHYGDLHMVWEWDVVHKGQLAHPLGDAWPWDYLLSRDLSPDGWADTVNASPGGGRDTNRFYQVKAVYGYRQILDLSDPTTLWFVLLPGQSGHPFHPHYADLTDEWLAGEYLPLRLAASPDEMEGRISTLALTPD